MATAADAAQARDEAEPYAERLYAAAVAYVAARAAAAEGEQDDDDDVSIVVLAAVALALTLILSTPRRYGSDVNLDALDIDPDEMAEAHGEELARQAIKHAEQHYDTVAKRVRKNNPDATGAEIRDVFSNDEAWNRAAARTLATEAATDTAIELHPLIEDATGERHDVLWVSRGDHKVRRSHRSIHGKVRRVGKSFKPHLTLRFPGDPLAPLNEVINCRCALLLVPHREARRAEDVFQVADADWETIDRLTASLRSSVGWDTDDAEMRRAADDLSAERSTV